MSLSLFAFVCMLCTGSGNNNIILEDNSLSFNSSLSIIIILDERWLPQFAVAFVTEMTDLLLSLFFSYLIYHITLY